MKYILYICLLSLFFSSATADVYMDIGGAISSTSEIFNANGKIDQERYLILNGVPISSVASSTNMTPLDAINEVYKAKLQEYNSLRSVANKPISENESEPIVVVNEEWSAIFKINSKEMINSSNLDQVEYDGNSHNQNYIVFAKKSVNNKSIVHELKFNNAMDVFRMFLADDKDVECNVTVDINRYPASRRKFCMTEITNEKIISQIVIYEGYGNPSVRISHYKDELKSQNYNLESIINSSHDRSILFAKSNDSNITVFTYKSQDKVLDILQSQF